MDLQKKNMQDLLSRMSDYNVVHHDFYKLSNLKKSRVLDYNFYDKYCLRRVKAVLCFLLRLSYNDPMLNP